MRKTKNRAAAKVSAATKKKIKLDQVVSTAKRFATAARDVNHNDLKRRIADNAKALRRLGVEQKHVHGSTVYANKQVALIIEKKKHASKAKRRHDNACPISNALRDSILGPYITDAYVGANTVKVKSILNPDMEVKFYLDNRMNGAVYKWDTTGRWPLEDGMYWLNPFPKSLRRGYKKPAGSKPRKVSAKTRVPTRHISLRTDIDKALLLAK